MTHVYDSRGMLHGVETAGAWLLGILWVLPLVYAFWTAFHPGEFSTRFFPLAPLTLDNFVRAWHAAPFARYFLNTMVLVTMVLAAQLVLVTLAPPAYLPFELLSVSYHWNNFLWPLIITNSVESRPLTVGLQVFSATDQGIDWSIITAATLLTTAPLLIAFLLFQRQFVQSFMRAGIR